MMLQSLYLTLKFQEIREVIQNNQVHEIINNRWRFYKKRYSYETLLRVSKGTSFSRWCNLSKAKLVIHTVSVSPFLD